MKKTYNKPLVLIENFSLSTSIAADCSLQVDTQSYGEYGCGYMFSREGMVFMDEKNMGCDITEPDGDYDGICYHAPTETMKIFNS